MSGCEVWFYHLEHSAAEQVLPELLEKTLARGWRAAVVSADPRRLEALDGRLWDYRDDSFLPHGLAGGPFDARQPILLAASPDAAVDADVLFLLDGEAGDLTRRTRLVVLIDGADPARVEAARALWRGYVREGRGVSYWRQRERGGWERQAAS